MDSGDAKQRCHSRTADSAGVNRLVGRDQRRDDDLDAFARGQHGRILHLAIDPRFQQEVRESPDIVQEYREHEVEQANAVVLRGRLREEVSLDALVLVFDLSATTVPATERLGLIRPDSEIRRENGRPLAARRRRVQESHRV